MIKIFLSINVTFKLLLHLKRGLLHDKNWKVKHINPTAFQINNTTTMKEEKKGTYEHNM